jgi:hypothetical protein
LVIHSQEHQVDVIQNLKEMIQGSGTGANMHSNFWLSMERKGHQFCKSNYFFDYIKPLKRSKYKGVQLEVMV